MSEHEGGETGPFDEWASGSDERIELTRLLSEIRERGLSAYKEIHAWRKENYPDGIGIEANTVIIDSDRPGIAMSYRNQLDIPIALS